MSELGPEARSILLAGKDGDAPTSQDRARVRRKLARAIAAGTAAGAASAATLAEGSAAAAAAKTAALLTFAKIGGGLLFVAALGAGIWSTRPMHPAAPPPEGAPAITAPSQTGTLPAEAAGSGAPEGADGPDAPSAAKSHAPSASDSPAASNAANPPAASGATPALTGRSQGGAAEPVDTLEEETRRLREAHGAMQSGDPEKALTLLDQQSSKFANGQLADERAVARILALCKLGRESEAQSATAELLRTSPNSPLTGRVRGGCPQTTPH